jgi:uncharacterized protein (DUF58 family)
MRICRASEDLTPNPSPETIQRVQARGDKVNLMKLMRRLFNRITRLWHFARPECAVDIRVRQPLFFGAWLVLLAWLILTPNPLAVTGLVTLSSLLLIGYGWTRSLAKRVTTQRELRYSAVQVGDELEELVALDNRSVLPVIWAEFVDRSTAPGYSISGVRIVGSRKTEQWRMHTSCSQRGVYTLGPWDVRLGDPFGIFEARQAYRQQTEIVVYPPLAAMPPEIAQQRRAIGDRAPLRQPVSAETINAMSTRPYVMGDALQRVHWRTSAKHDDLFVKIFEPEASATMWLIPDLDATVQLGEGVDSSLEKMIILTATIASRLLDQHLAVGVILDAAHSHTVLPQAGSAHLWTILRALALAQATPDRPLAQTLIHARSIVSLRDSSVILTPSLEAEWLKVLPHLSGGSRMGGVEAVLLDPLSFGGALGAEGFRAMLAEQGVPTHVVRRLDIRPATGTYGAVRRWEFKTLGTGRVAVVQTPRAA